MVRTSSVKSGNQVEMNAAPAIERRSAPKAKKADLYEGAKAKAASALNDRVAAKVEPFPGLGRAVSVVGARTWVAPRTSPTAAPVNITGVSPLVEGGDFPIHRIAGESLEVKADIIKEGHDKLRARVIYGEEGQPRSEWKAAEMKYDFNEDEWSAQIPLEKIGNYRYAIEAWTDHFSTWSDFMSRKAKAGKDISSELLEGQAMIKAAAARAEGADQKALQKFAKRLGDDDWPQASRAAVASEPELAALMRRYEAPADKTTSAREYEVMVERSLAKKGTWYELFPRSTSDVPGQHGTFKDAMKRLPEIKKMGFDVVYLPPIHPIGETKRKGKNNSEDAQPGDVGSPWAIGSKHGGHDAVHPDLGTMEDFKAFVKKTNSLGMEVALDFAVQCAPDHPWVKEHPDWFKRRPDGSIAYAENPPKVYQDIVPIDMWCEDRDQLWNAIKDVMMDWVDRGVKVFRVDNPHTKPMAFWEWIIREVRKEHPDVVFLSEAFSRPKKQDLLTKVGFSQSYTYFTWKNSRHELEQYMRELTGDKADHFRPNFFPNTPDILPEYLQTGGKPAFESRYALAATLSPSIGIYSGYELVENEALKGEDYLDSEKYQIKQRNFDQEGNIKGFISKMNEIREKNPALHDLTNLKLHNPDNQQLIAYSKSTEDRSNQVLVVANLDPHNKQAGMVHLDGEALGIGPNDSYKVTDLVTDKVWVWKGTSNFVELDPSKQAPVHVFRIEKD